MSGDERSGAWMSSKQMARAATAGRQVTFHWFAGNHRVEGYLVGMDDFNWLVVSKHPSMQAQIVLVHKASPDVTTIDHDEESSLDLAPDYLKVAVEQIGRGFFTYCEKTFLGKTT